MPHFLRLIACLIFPLCFIDPVLATLVDGNDPAYPASSDGMNVTTDTATNLRWLDWTVTTDISFNDMTPLFAAGMQYDGWRHATSAEVKTLFANAGMSSSNWNGTTSNNDSGASYATLVGHIGQTYGSLNDGTTRAVVSDSPTLGLRRNPTAFINAAGNSANNNLNTSLDAGAKDYIGHALVQSVPESNQVACLALLVLVVFAWSKTAL